MRAMTKTPVRSIIDNAAENRPADGPVKCLAARVLIVDDEKRIRLALRSCLEADGYDIHEAADGNEALAEVVRDPLLAFWRGAGRAR